MNTDKNEEEADEERGLNQITEQVIGCACRVANTLGVGFLEKVYQNALVHELRKAGLKADPLKPIAVMYDGVVVGEYIADIFVADSVLVELKAAKAIDEVHVAQCLNYLKATGMRVCLQFNFGTPRLGIKRLMF